LAQALGVFFDGKLVASGTGEQILMDIGAVDERDTGIRIPDF
jgi:hypothetical protein